MCKKFNPMIGNHPNFSFFFILNIVSCHTQVPAVPEMESYFDCPGRSQRKCSAVLRLS